MNKQVCDDLYEKYVSGEITSDEITRMVNKYLETNEQAIAYPYICALAKTKDSSAYIDVTAGLVALSLSKKKDAAIHFKHALEKEPNHFDAGYNSALLEMGEGNYSTACEILSQLVKLNPDNGDLYNDLAVVYTNLNQSEKAFEYWQKALTINPNHSLARDNAMEYFIEKGMPKEGKRLLQLNAKIAGLTSASANDIKQWEMKLDEQEASSFYTDRTSSEVAELTPEPSQQITHKKIAVFASMDTFVNDIISHLKKDNEVKKFTSGSTREILTLLEWADIAWFEWCDNFIIEATKFEKVCKIVCRLHSYEAFTDMPSQVNWDKVDLLVFVNESVKNIFERRINISTPKIIVPNAVDGERFMIPPDKRNGKKIASVGYINYKKNPALLLYCFKKIYEYDREYSLHIAGQHQDPRIQLYFEHFLKENPLPVFFDGWIKDITSWYADKNFVISTSLFESFHYSIAEGMASGLLPLIHNWYGAKNIYPNEFIFNDPDECVELLKRLEEEDRQPILRKNRQFILDRYSLSDKLAELSEELFKLFKTTDTKNLILQKV